MFKSLSNFFDIKQQHNGHNGTRTVFDLRQKLSIMQLSEMTQRKINS